MKIFDLQNVRTKLALSILGLFSIGLVSAQNLVYETFNYTPNSTLTSNGYTAHSNAGSNAIKVTDSALIFAGYNASGIGRAITIDTTGEDINKGFSSRNSGSVYASFLVKVTKVKSTGDYFFHLGMSTIGSTFFAKVFAKADAANPGKFAFGVSKANNSATATYTSFNYYEDSTYLLVVSYSFVTGTANDTVTLWINPTSAAFSTPTLSASDNTLADKTSIGTYALRQGTGSAAPQVKLSGFKVDTLWTNLFGFQTPVVATPTFSIPAGIYNNDTVVSVSCATVGANIYYTLNGTTPTSGSTLYTGPISIDSTNIIKAAAFKVGMDSSAVASATYSLQAAAPMPNIAAGTYTSAQTLTLLSSTVGSVIHYTTDGSVPNSNAPIFTTPINIGSTITLKAIAYKSGYDSSAVFTGIYTINISTVNAPQMSVAGGTFYNDQSVSITSTTTGVAIHYTIDGTTPTSNSSVYTAAIAITQSKVLKAIAYLSNDSSLVTTESYTLMVDTVFSNLSSGSYSGTQSVVLSCPTLGASIYYTTDGTTPNQNSSIYSNPISVQNSLTLKAMASKAGWDTSIVSSWNYVITIPAATFPLIDSFAYGINNALTSFGYNAHSSIGFNPIKVYGQALGYPNYILSNSGNSILIDTTGEDVNKLVGPLNSGVVYASFLVKVMKATTDGEYFFHFGNDVLSTTFRGKIFVKASTNPGFIQFGVSKSSNTGEYSQDYSIDSTFLIVVKYSLQTSSTSDDSVMLWVNPHILSKNNPNVICADLTASDLLNVGTFAFRQGSYTKAARIQLSGFMMDTLWENILIGINPVLQAPTVVSSPSTAILIHNATLNGIITSDGNVPISERGFIYSTHSNLTIADSVVKVAGTIGSYSSIINHLTENETYFFQAYAINAIDTSYGVVLSFHTLVDGIIERSQMAIDYYPNPVVDLLNIEGAKQTQISIHSVLGVEVYQSEINSDQFVLDLSDYKSGIYMISVWNNTGRTSFRIYKQ